MGLDKEPGLIHLETSVSEGRKYWNGLVPESSMLEKLGIMWKTEAVVLQRQWGEKGILLAVLFSTQRIYLSGLVTAYCITKKRTFWSI